MQLGQIADTLASPWSCDTRNITAAVKAQYGKMTTVITFTSCQTARADSTHIGIQRIRSPLALTDNQVLASLHEFPGAAHQTITGNCGRHSQAVIPCRPWVAARVFRDSGLCAVFRNSGRWRGRNSLFRGSGRRVVLRRSGLTVVLRDFRLRTALRRHSLPVVLRRSGRRAVLRGFGRRDILRWFGWQDAIRLPA